MSTTTTNTQAVSNTNAAKGLELDIFGSILNEDINWISFPAYPPQVKLAVLVGNPQAAGPYIVRLRLPGGTKFMPHMHKEAQVGGRELPEPPAKPSVASIAPF